MKDEPELDFGQDFKNYEVVEKARRIYDRNKGTSGTSFRIIYNWNTKRLWFAQRTFVYDVDWDYHIHVTPEEAEAIVAAGLAYMDSSLIEKPKPIDNRSLFEKLKAGEKI